MKLTREAMLEKFLQISHLSMDDIARYGVSFNDGYTLIRAVLKNHMEMILTYKSDYIWRLETGKYYSIGLRKV